MNGAIAISSDWETHNPILIRSSLLCHSSRNNPFDVADARRSPVSMSGTGSLHSQLNVVSYKLGQHDLAYRFVAFY